tara:strand:+ start:3210 stop:3647 length:438 start_codon:yes stop_codon:yes gene_type:complete
MNNLYNEIERYKEYFHSIRLHQDILLLDFKLPTKWEVSRILGSVETTTQMKLNDKTEEFNLVSFYCPFLSEETEKMVQDIDRIVKWNKDKEEKTYLLDLKILELKKMFDSNNLDSLRSINFEFSEDLKDINLGDGEKIKMVREGA